MQVRNLNFEDCKKLAEETLKINSTDKVESFLKKNLYLSEY